LSILKIVSVTNEIRKKLKKDGLLDEMSSLANCDFLAIIELNGKIIGASGVGGILHVRTLIVHNEFRNKGIGIKLLEAVIEEAKKRKYSFLTISRDPENLNLVKVHNFFGIKPVFQVKYRPDFTREVICLNFNKKGKLFGKFLQIFNTKIGMSILILSIKISKKFLFKSILTYAPEEFPDPDVLYAVKNFQKLNKLD